MSLIDLNIKSEYRSLIDNVVDDFYVPVLKESVLYQRAVGFFSSSALIAISKGVEGLISNGGKIQIIASPRLSQEDIDEIRKGYEVRKVLERALLRGIETHNSVEDTSRLSYIASLIANGVLDIKINLFDRICQYTPHDAINAAAFRRIGYTLNSSYVYCSSYGTALNFFEETVFSKDIVDLTSLDRRMVNLGMFAAALDKKKKTLEYIETAPKILMSIEKIRTVYDLSVEEIREIQSLMSVFYDEPFFNGRSIWAEVENLPIVQKLQGNDWMLTCIMRQQDAVASLSVAGGIILSLESASLNLSRICEWIASTHGKMSITNLEHTFNETFGTRIPASKLAEKLRTSGSWDAVVTDSMDEYIDSLVDAGLSDIDADDLLQEEFF